MKKILLKSIAIASSTGILLLPALSASANAKAEELLPETVVSNEEPNTENAGVIAENDITVSNENSVLESDIDVKENEENEEITEIESAEVKLFGAQPEPLTETLQSRIDALPLADTIAQMSDEEKQALSAELGEICDIYYEFTEDEQAQITGFDTVGELFQAMGAYETSLLADGTYGDFVVTGDDSSGIRYTSAENAGGDYQLYGWNVGTYHRNGVLEITKSGTYSIKMKSGVDKTTDRIKIKSGINVNLTIENLNIAPHQTDGSNQHYGEGRPFDMKGATVNLTLVGTNTLNAPSFSTALFCPANSTLTIDGDGTLNVRNEGKDLCVAGIGGEGKVRNIYTYANVETSDQTIVKGQEQFARLREWPDDNDSRCGNITINGSPKINVELKIGDWYPVEQTDDAENVDFQGLGKKWCLLKTPSLKYTRKYKGAADEEIKIDLGQTTYLVYNQIVGIGGAYSGNITINGGTVDVKTSVLATGIGSVNKDFGKISITGGTVTSQTGWKAVPEISFTDYVGGSSIGPAIGWAEYGNSQPSNMVIEIAGGTVNAKSSYGAAGIGGGVDSTGGTIIISGGDVTAKGGFNGAGIGSGIGQSITGTTTGEGKIIITGGTVNATGGNNAAGIGGGGNPLGNDKTGGQSGTIIIAGDAKVTAQGGQNAPGIGAGGAQSQNDYNANAGKVQAIIITTTGHVEANGGTGAPTNIGAAKLGNDTTTEQRYVGSVIVNTSDAVITGTFDKMPNTVTRDTDGNLVVKGNVDIVGNTHTANESETISQEIANYLTNNSKNIVASGSTPSLTVTPSQQDTISTKAQGVSVNGAAVPTVTITISSNGNGTVSINGSGTSATVAKGSLVTIKATPSDGYVFDKWSDGNTSAERTITVNSATTLTASFKTASNNGSGSGSGSGNGQGSGGSSGTNVTKPQQNAGASVVNANGENGSIEQILANYGVKLGSRIRSVTDFVEHTDSFILRLLYALFGYFE